MAHRPTPTLHDVSAKAGVSTATVSRTLNFPNQVSEPTRTRVLAAVSELGYSPNFGARAMASRRTNTIGAVIPTMENAIFARGLQAFQEELRGHGFTMLVASTSYQPDIEADQIRALVARGADALLLIGHDRDPSIYDFLKTQGIPTLITWAFDPAAPRPSVGFDNRAAMHKLATKVIGFGHDRIAMITAKTLHNDRASARVNGVRDAMRAAGQDPDTLSVFETTYGIDEGAIAFDKVLDVSPRPTAVLCGNDVLAVGALRRARELGISVPEGISITGFDDIELAQLAVPPLTTVHVSHREMGRRAGLALAEMVKNNKTLETIEIAAEPVMRGTLGPANPDSTGATPEPN